MYHLALAHCLPSCLGSLCVFQVQTELSFVVASLSFSSVHVSVDPTVVVVRVMLD